MSWRKKTPQLHSTTLNICPEILVLTVISPCHPAEKDETHGNKVRTYLHCNTHTSNPLGEQNSLSILKYRLQINPSIKWRYVYQVLPVSPQAFTRAQNAEEECWVPCSPQLQSTFHIYLITKIISRYDKEFIEWGKS